MNAAPIHIRGSRSALLAGSTPGIFVLALLLAGAVAQRQYDWDMAGAVLLVAALGYIPVHYVRVARVSLTSDSLVYRSLFGGRNIEGVIRKSGIRDFDHERLGRFGPDDAFRVKSATNVHHVHYGYFDRDNVGRIESWLRNAIGGETNAKCREGEL